MKKCLYNYYPEKLSFFECLGKEMRYMLKSVVYFFQNRCSVKRIFVYPNLPGSKAIISKVAKNLHLAITNNPRKNHVFALAWEDATTRVIPEVLAKENLTKKVLNIRNNNIMKSFVDDFFYEVFAYKTRIDPEKFSGLAVCKSEFNATHSGEIVQCPVSAEEGCIYQILIDNKDENGFFEDIRVVVVAQSLPEVYVKLKPESSRFETRASKVLLKKADDCLSLDEQEKILTFARIIGLDLGEIDVLRNRRDGKLYIIDVNNTPYGPPANLSKAESEQSIAIIAKAVRENFI